MTQTLILELADQIEVVFFTLGGAILLIELAEAFFKGDHKGRTILEMIVSASTQIPYLFVEVIILTSFYGLYYLLSVALVPWNIPITWWSIIAVLIAADFIYYWEHRIAHEVRLLWTQHAVHHSSRDYNIVTGVRFGPLEGVWSLLAHLPLILLGFPPELVFFGVIVVLAYQTWLHTELIGKLGPLEWVLNTPSHHRVHHGSDDKYLDKNYGGISIIWDRLFGTFQVEEETPRYGLKRDFNSKNPVRVWFSEIPGLVRDMAGAKSWGDMWRYLVKHPGWTPDR
ncbi:MAG: sterol desaturase family protein [Rhodobacteraceae bacterium]|nr:sterol desaturase family protein [Paracoccaceae bacterium]